MEADETEALDADFVEADLAEIATAVIEALETDTVRKKADERCASEITAARAAFSFVVVATLTCEVAIVHSALPLGVCTPIEEMIGRRG